MKKILKSCAYVSLATIVLCIAGVAVMFATKLCPPAGPWPMPPWCAGSQPIFESIATSTIPAFSPFYDQFGCLPKDCSMIPDEEGRKFCTEYQAGNYAWGNCSDYYANEACKKLCESEKKEIVPVTEKITLNDAIIVPSDISKINYPDFYNNSTTTTETVENPYCAITKEEIAYPVAFLGTNDFPKISGAPLPPEIIRTVGIKDVWITEPNNNNCRYSVPFIPMREAYEKTLTRVNSLGADSIAITNYIHFVNFQKAELQPPSEAAVSEDDMRFIANLANERNLGVILYLNLAPGKETVSWEIPNKEWLVTLIHNWEPFVLNQAQIAEETGIDALMINHFDYQPGVKGFEETYQNEMLSVLQKVRQIYSGKVLLMIDPLMGSDLGKYTLLLDGMDGYIYTPITAILNNESNKTLSVGNLKNLYLENLRQIGNNLKKFKKPLYLRILIQSEIDFLEKGWNEDMFCIKKEDDPCYQKKLQADFSIQAIAYEAMMEAIKQFHNQYYPVGAVDTYGYWFTDVILSDVSQPQIAQSVRNKPAESIVYEWFKR